MEYIKLLTLIERIGNMIRDDEIAKGYDLEIEPLHTQILGYLYMCNKYSKIPQAIGEFVGCKAEAVKSAIRLLEDKELIESVSPDGAMRYELTEKGNKYVCQHYPPHHVVSAIIGLKSENRQLLDGLLTEMLKGIKRTNGGKVFGTCSTCRHFRQNGLSRTNWCGLAQEALTDEDSVKICHEYEESTRDLHH